MKHTIFQRMISTAVITAVILPFAGGLPAPGVSAESAAVSTGNPYYSKVSAPVRKPLWSFTSAATSTPQSSQSVTAVAENGMVFALQKNYKLVALKAATGQKLWEYGSALAPLFTYSNGTIYGLTQKGALYAVKENGTKLWSADITLPNASNITRIGSVIYVIQRSTIAAVDAASGKIKWKITEANSNYYGLEQLTESDGVVLRSYIGESTLALPALAAYDAKTGKKLWEQYRQSFPLAIKDGLLYSEKRLEMLDDDPVNRKILISVLNVKTGELKGERFYRWTDTKSADRMFQSRAAYGSAFLESDQLYVFQGEKIARYDFWKYTEDGKPAQVWEQSLMENEVPLNKVLQQRMLYYNYSSGSLSAMKLANGQFLRLNEGENPVVQLDIFGNAIYAGQSDGLFHVYDLLSFKPLFTVNAGSRDFLPSLKTGNMLIVRSGGKLLGVRLPASVK